MGQITHIQRGRYSLLEGSLCGSKAREQRVQCCLKHALFPKPCHTRMRNKADANRKWKHSSRGGCLPVGTGLCWPPIEALPVPIRVTWFEGPLHTASELHLCTATTHILTASLPIQLIPQTRSSHEAFYSFLPTCRPLKTSPFSRGSFVTKTNDVKSFTSSYLQSLFYSLMYI